jgi:hypothetical protein
MVAVFVAFFCGFDSSILQGFYVGLKHEISVWKSRENPLEKNLSIVVSFVVTK